MVGDWGRVRNELKTRKPSDPDSERRQAIEGDAERLKRPCQRLTAKIQKRAKRPKLLQRHCYASELQDPLPLVAGI